MKLALVVTTIQAPNVIVRELSAASRAQGADFVVIGDRKTPQPWVVEHGRYWSLEDQAAGFQALATALPVNHYTRKNIGYLAALRQGADWIVETDDDNAPLGNFFDCPPASVDARTLSSTPRWVNAYHYFAPTAPIWPRGLPLEHLQAQAALPEPSGRRQVAPAIVQGLANDNPDVDAVFRLTRSLPVDFGADSAPLWLAPGQWCPFNSQNTWTARAWAPLLYLPSHCSFRMTDIWRSFVAQRCLWEAGEGVLFIAPSVRQDRNEHNLLKDFADEVPGYLQNQRISEVLERTALTGVVAQDLRLCYAALHQGGIFPAEELVLVDLWLKALEDLG
ncbi:MAG: STELLO glycosyltransferase family protein [Stagnimonas sp.]|nr:STELLO glycosyltransferase family protein [Stagnimonas sp.]